jgi:signal transduction histidine kinase
LRRVATLVAERAPPARVFEAVCAEVGRLIPADGAALTRYEADGTLTTIASWTTTGGYVPSAMRLPIEQAPVSSAVHETARPHRIDNWDAIPGEVAARGAAAGWRSAVAVPLIVSGRPWGTVIVMSKSGQPMPPDTEARLTQFTDLAATAIADAESRAELAASRARIITTADATRRRIERDLHDGVQQQLLSIALELRNAQAGVPPELDQTRAQFSRAVDGLTNVLDELREIAHGIHPAILAQGGLGPALKTLGRRSPVPVQLEFHDDVKLPERVEVAAYYVVAEALANAAKYAQASAVRVEVQTQQRNLRVSVRDDGLGGANPSDGSGLTGLKDRAEALGGAMTLHSPPGGGTTLQVELPLEQHYQ